MLDFDLARIYGVETKSLNRAVKRNAKLAPQVLGTEVVVACPTHSPSMVRSWLQMCSIAHERFK